MPTRGLQDELDRPRVTHQLDAEGGGREAKGFLCRITQVLQPMKPPTFRSNVTSDHGRRREEDKRIVKGLFSVSAQKWLS